ncbi:MAG TPA: polysaccharide deacetylase family protein [Gemmatimonadales bacterium]|nr:polysaccharide deacetylase family protein [Gemmatimonadales bacterium]
MRQRATGLTLRSAYYGGVRALGLPALVRRWRDAGVVLGYHNVLPPRNGGSVGDRAVHLPVEAFSEQIRWLARRYRIVSLGEMVTRLSSGRSLRGMAALTFDDGYEGVFTHAWPLLRRLGLAATVFIVAERPDTQEAFWWDHPDIARNLTSKGRERWLGELKGDGSGIASALSLMTSARLPHSHRPAGWDTIRAAAREGLEIGVHSATHRSLTRLDDAELERELVHSRDTVRLRTGADPDLFAYPYGLWDARVHDAARAAGYRGAVTLDYGLVSSGADPWALRRVNVPAGISLPAFEAWVAGLHPRRGHD